jgi:antitoxin (DNA-binding transcriptional repressor) of toxin-antitoxin stability system
MGGSWRDDQNLSRVLRDVAAGASYMVTSRGKPVAEIKAPAVNKVKKGKDLAELIALDSNFPVYFFEIGRVPGDDAKILAAQQLLGELGRCTKIVIPVQVCGEFYNVAVRSKRTSEVAPAMVHRLWLTNA